MSLILGKAVPAPGKPDLSEKAERAFRVARERREEEVWAELREKIAAGLEAEAAERYRINRGSVRAIHLGRIAAQIRAREFG